MYFPATANGTFPMMCLGVPMPEPRKDAPEIQSQTSLADHMQSTEIT
jgi:hypothetical protein